MNNSYVKNFTYNRDSSKQFIEIFNREKDLPDASLSIFSHILNAHIIWLNRIKPLQSISIPETWERQSIADFSELNEFCFEKTISFLKNERPKTGEIITYKNSKGREYRNSVEEIYFHMLMHSMYHRGQVAKQFNSVNIEPPVTDFIFYMREQRMEA